MIPHHKHHDFLVGIDSDGCAFDTMELKHKECFIPHIINFYELQGVSKFARQAAEFVNLYSKSRGINRFPALIETLKLLQRWPDVRRRGVKIDVPPALVDWIRRETKLGNPALEAAVRESNDPELRRALDWSTAINRTIEGMVRGVAPFPGVRDVLKQLQGRADVLVVSATPQPALIAEWEEHDLRQHVAAICGQESGTKKEILAVASQYSAGHVLMIGDAPGDRQAAEANGCLFFPINPDPNNSDSEEQSWANLRDEGLGRFMSGTFAGKYQQTLIEAFDRCLPAEPPWEQERA
ncbi:MAG: HAD hydrolase-like protein [Planctomycetia bacterium]|nr:HAD hydrolase-like protein [Planctomycetia bacterium]